MALDGRYKISGEAMGTKLEGILTLKSAGAKLTGTVEIQGVTVPLEDGSAKGDTFTGSVLVGTPMGDKRFKVAGKVAGNQIEGTLKAMLINARFTGKRI